MENFEDKIKNAKDILDKLLDPSVSLKEGMKHYKDGVKQLKQAQKMLEEAKIEYEKINNE